LKGNAHAFLMTKKKKKKKKHLLKKKKKKKGHTDFKIRAGKNHALFETKLAKIETLFMSNTAKKIIFFGAGHTYMTHIRQYPSPGNSLVPFIETLFSYCVTWHVHLTPPRTKYIVNAWNRNYMWEQEIRFNNVGSNLE